MQERSTRLRASFCRGGLAFIILLTSTHIFPRPAQAQAQAVYVLNAINFPCIAKNIRNHEGINAPNPMEVRLTRTDHATAKTNRGAACGPSSRKVVYDYNKRAKGTSTRLFTDEVVSCDEFPFASTAEGGIGAKTLVISNDENTRAGRDLLKFYTRNNVRVGDQFIIRVSNETSASNLRKIFVYGVQNPRIPQAFPAVAEVCISRETSVAKYRIPKAISDYLDTLNLDVIELD